MTYFCTLASGSAGNCSLYVNGRQRMLVDAGKNTRYINDCLRQLALSVSDLTHITRCCGQYRNRLLESLGLTTRQASLLRVIWANPGISQDMLARRICINKSNIARQIVVLEEGAIVEDGTHAELSQAGGVYESLWDRQTGAFLEGE